MARTLKTIRVTPNCKVSIGRTTVPGEFRVRAIVNGKVTGGAANGGYFTEDKADARSTAAHMIRQLRQLPQCGRAVDRQGRHHSRR